MENIGHILHAWLIFITPLKFLGYKPPFRKQALFTVLYGLGIILFRRIYDFLPVPFGTHMILLSILYAILLATILREIDRIKAVYISLITFIIIQINDSIILVPFLKYFDITISEIGNGRIVRYITIWTLSNFLLIISYIVGILRPQKKQSYKL